MTPPLRVLCLDIEGGHGGSSRSLYFSLKHMDRSRITPTVWCRRAGPIQQRYAALGIETRIEPDLPKASALPRATRNLWQLGELASDIAVASRSGTLARLLDSGRRHDVIHFNHEGFAALAWWLRRQLHMPTTMHIRTNVVASPFARLQMRTISRSIDHAVFITPNEEKTFRSLGGKSPGRVIFNVVEPGTAAAPHTGIPRDGRLIVASVANAAVVRGTDQLIAIAEALKALGSRDILIAVAGDMRLTGRWPAPLQSFAARGATLADAAEALGLSEYFLFLGHVAEPEGVLAAADVLIKPTREDNPWGRDILEAMAAGLPVISIGSDSTFVETGVTGILQPTFDASALARELVMLADARDRLASLGTAARERVAKLCNGPDRARDLADVWRSAAAQAA